MSSKSLWFVVRSTVLLFCILHCVNADNERSKKGTSAGPILDYDLLGLQHLEQAPIEDRLNYALLCQMKREREQYADDKNRNISKSREQYENQQFEKIYNAVFSTKPPHLRTSEENYIQFCKDKFFAKQRGNESPKTSQERYEWFLKKSRGSFFGGKYDAKTWMTGNFTARRRRRRFAEYKGKQHAQHIHSRKKRHEYDPPAYEPPVKGQVVDYLNERMYNEHQEKLSKLSNKNPWDKKNNKPLAYYTSNEDKNKPYVFNERALLERANNKKADYDNYMADESYRNKPKAYYFTDHANYRNMPKGRLEKMRMYQKQKYRPMMRWKRNPTRPTPTTWAAVHYTYKKIPLKYNYSQEVRQQMEENVEIQRQRQVALDEKGIYRHAHELEPDRTTYRLSTYRNFVEEMKTPLEPYTFHRDTTWDYVLDNIESGLHIPDEEITTPRGNYKDWIQDQLASYRRGYHGLTVAHPFAHYPEYSWENHGFDLGKIEDPFPPVWPLDKVKYNVEALRAHMATSNNADLEPAEFVEGEWYNDEKLGKRRTTKPSTKRVIIPV